jgi:site-specific recombinase
VTQLWDLSALINAADARASLVERQLWLVRLLEWLRHAPRRSAAPRYGAAAGGLDNGDAAASDGALGAATPWPLRRLKLLLSQLDKQPALREEVRALAVAFWRDIDAPALFADLGFGARRSFAAELLARVQLRLLPGTPDTRDLAALFSLLFEPADREWLAALDGSTWRRLTEVAGPGDAAARVFMLDAVTILASAIQAAGYSPLLRQRMTPELLRDEPFRQLSGAVQAVRQATLDGRSGDALRDAAYLRALLDRCRRAAQSVLPHLEEYGVSVNIVFELDQVLARAERIEQLLGAVLSPDNDVETHHLLLSLLVTLREARGLRALFARHYSLLARQVTERSAETGEHYITRTRAQWLQMLRRAAGGGAVIAGTTFVKFWLGALALSAFWAGMAAGLNYATSFVLVMLLHWTVATKQPAMTAPALAARLPAGRLAGDDEIEAFVDRVAQLIRSQAAAIVGNVAACAPLVLLLQGLAWWLAGSPLVGADDARYVLHGLTLLGPTALFAAFTGVLLFASSLIAGWAENWFVYHRLDSAIAWNPRIVQRLGAARAQRWARWWRQHVSGLAANVSLGMLLGLAPAVLSFVGLPLEVRHVTLASGQLAAALGALGVGVFAEPAFWWCVAGIAVTGLLNLGVSFGLAFSVALRSRGVQVQVRSRIMRALWQRARSVPLSLVWPPKD